MIVTLLRTKENQFGTHGHIEDNDGTLLCYTIERPWLDNAHDVSCIPTGTYDCIPHIKSNNGQRCWQLMNVPDRTGVLIHTGNTERDSEGCIIVGLMFSEQGVTESLDALAKLHSILPAYFTLEIKT